MATHNRRALHQPFYPLVDSPPTPPSPFFPLYPSPPPPKPSLPSIPTNPSSPLISHRHSRHNLLPLVAVPAAALAVLLLALVAALLRRRSSAAAQSRRLFPPDDDGSKLPAAAPNSASEFLYLGTLISSRSGDPSVPAARSPYLKLGSPELRPLPPLSRHADNGGCSSEEDSYYSPSGGSPADKRGNVGSVSRSPKVFPITVSGKCESTFSTVSSPSYPSSPSSPLISSSPIEFRPSPKRETLSPQLEKESNVKSKSSGLNGIGDFARNPFVMGPPPSRAPPTPPPPPPPLLETRVSKLPIGQPPVLLPPKPIGAKINAAAIFPADATDNWDGSQKSEGNKRRLKLKPLHWDKVRAKSDQAMVWDLLRSSSFKIDEEMIEALFVCETTNSAMVQQVGFSSNQENGVLDPKKSQNIAIILRALSVTKEEVCEGLLEGNTERLGNELLETLLKMAPSKEEEFRLKEYKDDGPFKLGPAEKFLKAVLDVPFAFKRLDAMLYITDFESEINYLRQSFQMLEAACAELRSSRLFFKLLEAVLKTGNRMNVGTNHGDAQAFKLDTLLKLADVKGTDGKTTLLHFVVQEIIKAEGARFSASESDASTSQDDLECTRIGLRVLSGLGGELCNVRKAASTDPDVLSDYVTKLSGGIGKVSEVLGLNQELNSDRNQRFHDSMNGFLKRADNEIVELQVQQRSVMSLVKDITVYFHGDSAKEEAHPIRIFLVVRDFLAILDQVCKEVGRINERNICSMNRISVVVNPAVFPKISTLKLGSSDDESLSSSSF